MALPEHLRTRGAGAKSKKGAAGDKECTFITQATQLGVEMPWHFSLEAMGQTHKRKTRTNTKEKS